MVACNSAYLRNIVVVSDLGDERIDARLLASFAAFISNFQPDELLVISGSSKVSRQNEGLGAHDSMFRAVEVLRGGGFNGAIKVQRSNRARMEAGAELNQSRRIDWVRELEVQECWGSYNFAPGWVSIHVEEFEASTYPGRAAIRLARAKRRSVLCGGTGSLGLIVERTGSRAEALWGMEIGSLIRPRSQDFRHWAQGFGVLEVNREVVQPRIVEIQKNSFAMPTKETKPPF